MENYIEVYNENKETVCGYTVYSYYIDGPESRKKSTSRQNPCTQCCNTYDTDDNKHRVDRFNCFDFFITHDLSSRDFPTNILS